MDTGWRAVFERRLVSAVTRPLILSRAPGGFCLPPAGVAPGAGLVRSRGTHALIHPPELTILGVYRLWVNLNNWV